MVRNSEVSVELLGASHNLFNVVQATVIVLAQRHMSRVSVFEVL